MERVREATAFVDSLRGPIIYGPVLGHTKAQLTEKRIAMTFLSEKSPEYLETFYPSYIISNLSTPFIISNL